MNPNRVARLISAIASAPIVAAVTFTLLIMFTDSSLSPIVVALLFGTLIPLSLLYYLSKRKVISGIEVLDRDSRSIPFAGVLVSYLLGTIVLEFVKATPVVTGLMLCYFANTLVMTLISLKWKISVHASGMTGPLTALIFQFGLLLSPTLLLAIPVGWSRLEVKAHNLSQVLAGGLITISLTWFQLLFYAKVL